TDLALHPRPTDDATSKPTLFAYTHHARTTTCATTAEMPAKTRPNAASETGYMMAPGDDTCTAPSAALIAAHATIKAVKAILNAATTGAFRPIRPDSNPSRRPDSSSRRVIRVTS